MLELAALKGVFTDVVEEPVSYVNAPLLAEDRGVAGRTWSPSADSPDYRNLVTVRGMLRRRRAVSVSRHADRPAQIEKVVEVNGFDVEVAPTEHMAFFRYDDRPGIVGTVGRILGEPASTSPACRSSRDAKGGQALVALTVDSAIPADVVEQIVSEIGADTGRPVDLEDERTETAACPGRRAQHGVPGHQPDATVTVVRCGRSSYSSLPRRALASRPTPR